MLCCSTLLYSESQYITSYYMFIIPPVSCLRFVSDWTQPLDILSTDSEFVCYYLSDKGCLGNPTLGTNLGQRILSMRTGCSPEEGDLLGSGALATSRALARGRYVMLSYVMLVYGMV